MGVDKLRLYEELPNKSTLCILLTIQINLLKSNGSVLLTLDIIKIRSSVGLDEAKNGDFEFINNSCAIKLFTLS